MPDDILSGWQWLPSMAGSMPMSWNGPGSGISFSASTAKVGVHLVTSQLEKIVARPQRDGLDVSGDGTGGPPGLREFHIVWNTSARFMVIGFASS